VYLRTTVYLIGVVCLGIFTCDVFVVTFKTGGRFCRAMFELSSVDVHYAVQELQRLVGSKIEKVFQGDNKRDLFFILYTGVENGSTKRNIRFLLPGIVCFPKEKGAYPQSPPGFAMFLRKHLGGARITGVEQFGFDRVIRIRCARKDADYSLIVELFHPGNMLLLDKEERIINLLEVQQYKDRTLRGKQQYIPPPACNDIVSADTETLVRRIMESTRDSIVTTLAVHLSLGGTYAEEVCVRAGIAKHRNDLSQDEVRVVVDTVRSLLREPIMPHADAHRPYPFLMRSKETHPTGLPFLDSIALNVPQEAGAVVEKKVKSSPDDKLRSLIAAQERQASSCDDEARGRQRAGELIYENYMLVKELLTMAKEARERKQDVASAMRGRKEFISYNEKNGEMTLEIPNGSSDGISQEGDAA